MKKLPSPTKVAKALTILILLIFLLSAGYLFLPSHHGKSDMIAEIYQNGALIHTINLSDVTQPYCITIDGENGATNVIQIRSGSIGILSANCPDQICVRQGFLTNDLLPITCLPNHLVIRLVPVKDDSDALDAITY